MRFGFGLLLVLSGFASLAFQLTWVRLIGLGVGGSSESASVVITAFFLGLSLGSWLAPKWLSRVSALRAYWLAELTIGASGVVLLPLLLRLDDWMAWIPALGGMLWFKFVVAVVLLLIPTVCMGATFPLAVAVTKQFQARIGKTYSELYALNTLGAVAGAGLSGFVLVPRLGLDGTTWLAAGTNALIAGVGCLLERRSQGGSAGVALTEPTASALPSDTLLQRYGLGVLAGTGFISIAVELCWTKLLTLFVGTTLYGFSAVLALYLFGIALGSWLVRSRLDSWKQPALSLALGLSLLGFLVLLSCYGVNQLPVIQSLLDKQGASAGVAASLRYAVVLALLLPPTLVLGGLFPISLRVACPDGGAQVGRAYSVNSLAGIVASVTCGLYLIPTLGTSVVLKGAAVTCVALALLFTAQVEQGVRRRLLGALAVGTGVLAVLQPGLNLEALINSVRQDRAIIGDAQLRLLFLKEGRTGVISAATNDEQTAIIYDSGLRESIVLLRNPDNGLFVESMLALYPYLLHPAPRSAFVVGFGGGATMRALEFTQLERIRVIELEPAMKDAVVALVGAGPAGVLDPRLSLEINDARNALLLDRARYDIIASQPSHPWRAGAGTIFTRQFFELAASRLNPGGIYSQWVNLFRMDVPTLKAISRAFLDVFPEVICFVYPGTSDMLLVGSQAPLVFHREQMLKRMSEPRVLQFLSAWNAASLSAMLSPFGLSRAELLSAVGPGRRSTDTNLLPEVRLGRPSNTDDGGGLPLLFLKQHAGFDVLAYLEPASRALWLQELVGRSAATLVSQQQLEARFAEVNLQGKDNAALP
jgi:spermidine synthase